MSLRACNAISHVVLLLLTVPVIAQAAPRGPYAQQLARQCDILLEEAIRRPYGWGWDTVPLESAAGRNTPRHVQIDPPGTPGAALILLWASQLLDEPRYQQAALEAARGLIASQAPTGKIPEHAMFAVAGPTSRDPASPVPDRAATRAAIALFISILQSNPNAPETLRRSSQRAAQWLVRQQADDGTWPYAHPLDPEGRRSTRIIRLDLPDYRDSTLTLLMTGDALGDVETVRMANKAAAKLISLRIGPATATPAPTTQAGADGEVEAPPPPVAANITNLWTTAYRLDGGIDPSLSEFPLCADMLASRMAMQTLIGTYLVTGQQQAGLALDASSRAAMQLRSSEAQWRKVYLAVPTTQPEEPSRIFAAPTSQPYRETGLFGLPATLESAQQLKQVGQIRYLNMLSGKIGLYQQIASTISGMNDNPFALDMPISRAEVAQYLRDHPERFAELEMGMPRDLSVRVRRLWLLLLRTRLEMMQQAE